MSLVRSSLLGMSEAFLFPEVPGPAPHPRAGPGGELRPAPARASVPARRSVIDGLRWSGGRRVLVTSGRLDARNLAELRRAARFGPIEVRFRIPTPDRRLAAVLDRGAPPPALRFAALR